MKRSNFNAPTTCRTSHRKGKPSSFHLFLYLLFVLFYLIFTGCDLFNGTKEDDFLKKLDEEVDWAAAKSVAITVDFPPGWGSSPQLGKNNVRDTKGRPVKVGYEFEISFTPNDEYSFLGWRAYKTEDLPYTNMTELTALLDRAEFLDNIILPQVDEGGGACKLTINTPGAITLVPFSRAQPRIISSVPDGNIDFYDFYNPISITFASPLDSDTVNPDAVAFTAKELDATGEPQGEEFQLVTALLIKSVSLSDSRTMIITPTELSFPENAFITLYLTTDLKIASGYSLQEQVKVVSWKTREEAGEKVSIDEWEAKYDENKEEVKLNWKLKGGSQTHVAPRLRYRIHNGTFRTVSPVMTVSFTPGKIDHEYSFDTSGSVSGSLGFEIWIDYIIDGAIFEMDEPIIIANINGMTTNNIDKNFTVIRTFNELVAIQDDIAPPNITLNKVYVLFKDINIASEWEPLGVVPEYFMGNFYGLGKTITISGGIDPEAEYAGLFGSVKNAGIQDLTVIYATPNEQSFSGGLSVFFGGIAGYAEASSIQNCQVRNGFRVELQILQAVTNAWMGGIVGELANPDVFTGNSSTLNLALRTSDTPVSISYMGGIIGRMYVQDINSEKIAECWSSGNITINSQYGGSIIVGGLIGLGPYHGLPPRNLEILECYATGNLNITSQGSIYAGGLVGFLYNQTTIKKSWTSGNIVSNTKSTGNNNSGGLVGFINDDGNKITDSYTLGNVTVEAQDDANSSTIQAGGIVGSINSEGFFIFTNDTIITGSFAFGNVKIRNKGLGNTFAGGIAGNAIDGSSISNTVALGNIVTATNTSPIAATRAANRILGGGTGTLTNNYAASEMQVGQSQNEIANYLDDPPASIVTNGIPSNINGANVSDGTGAGQMRNIGFWQSVFSASTENWDFSVISVSRPFPKLMDVGGQ